MSEFSQIKIVQIKKASGKYLEESEPRVAQKNTDVIDLAE